MILSTGPEVALFVGEACGRVIVPPFTALGLVEDGKAKIGAVFNIWTGPDIHMSAASDGRHVYRAFLREVGAYVFGQLGCERITVVTQQPAVVRLAQRLGGQVEGVMRNHFGAGQDGTIIGILKNDWKY